MSQENDWSPVIEDVTTQPRSIPENGSQNRDTIGIGTTVGEKSQKKKTQGASVVMASSAPHGWLLSHKAAGSRHDGLATAG